MTRTKLANNRMNGLRDGLGDAIRVWENELDDLAEQVDAANLFMAVAANIMLMASVRAPGASGQDPPQLETLAFYLYPRFGASSPKAVTALQSQRCLNILNKLCSQQTMYQVLPNTEEIGDGAKDIARQVRAYTENVRGSAYPEQTVDKIIAVQGRFEDWFKDRLGIGPTRAQAILWGILNSHQSTLNDPDIHQAGQDGLALWDVARRTTGKQRTPDQNRLLQTCADRMTAGVLAYTTVLNRIAVADFPVSQENVQLEEAPPSQEEWEALIRLIGLTPTDRSGMKAIVDVRARPLYVLPDSRVILADISHALDALWERFDLEARQEQRFYNKSYQKWKAEWLEERISEYMKRIFPSSCVYRQLTYPDPDKADGAETELDVAVCWGPFLVIVEGKAKQFRLESQLGDFVRLSSDLAANIQDAFEQGRRALRYIEATDAPIFTEIGTGRKLILNKAETHRTYIVAASLHQFAGLATGLARLGDLKLFGDKEYPLAISVPDLDVVTQFCEGPEVLLHYIERRLDIQKNAQNVEVPDELDLFGAYLDTRLQAARIWEQDEKRFDSVTIDGYTNQFDAWAAYRRNKSGEMPTIQLKVPNEVRRFLSELRNRNDYGARWIAFALLSLPDHLLDSIGQFLAKVRQSRPKPGRFIRHAYQDGDVVISFVATVDVPPAVLCDRACDRALMEKYIRKATKSIGFGIALPSTRPFECAYWGEGPWKQDDDMERVIAAERPFLPTPDSDLPERNSPCFCGSGKKYKKCCLPNVEAARRNSKSTP